MIEGKTKTGFEYTVDPEILDDMEFIEMAAEAGDNGLKLPKLVSYVLGDEQKAKLYDHVRENGRVKASKIDVEMTEIFDAINAHKVTKNS